MGIAAKVCKKEVTFPCLMESTLSNLVVLFVAENKGTVIVSGNGWSIGTYCTDWASTDSGTWHNSQPVTISND